MPTATGGGASTGTRGTVRNGSETRSNVASYGLLGLADAALETEMCGARLGRSPFCGAVFGAESLCGGAE